MVQPELENAGVGLSSQFCGNAWYMLGLPLQKRGKHEKHGLGASRSVQCDNGSNRALYDSGEVAVGERDDRRGGQQGSKSG